MNGYVYLLVSIDSLGNELFKIGLTKKDVSKRISQLQTGNPNQIKLITYYESENYKMVERWLHSRYSQNKTLADNEWFNLSNDDVMNFTETCKKIDSDIKMLIKENYFYK